MMISSIGKRCWTLLVLIASTSGQGQPTLCTNSNQGSCECGSDEVKTYVFKPGKHKRCIHTFIPSSNRPLPVLIRVDGYGQGMPEEDGMEAAKDYGFAVLGIGSTGPFDGAGGFGLDFPADGVINPANPTPCSASDSKDYVYLKGVLDFIDGMPDKLDATRVFVEGFSQSAMYAAYLSVCFADRIAGVWQGGSGLAKTFHTPVLPGMEGQCSLSDFLNHGEECCEDHFCETCTWWPIYPRTCQNTLISCNMAYTDDEIACGSDYYMYTAMSTEDNDARMLSFPPSRGIEGGHSNPQNALDWMVGCLGIVDSCSPECEMGFLECASNENGGDGPEAFRTCLRRMRRGGIPGCARAEPCGPTLGMLGASEAPEVVNLSEGRFGTRSDVEGTGGGSTAQKPRCDFGGFGSRGGGGCRPPKGSGPATGEIKRCGPAGPSAAPASTPTAGTTSPTRGEDGGCIPPGSSCFAVVKNSKGCDVGPCEKLVCTKRKQCCKKKWNRVCKSKAIDICTPCECRESAKDKFVWKRKKSDDSPVLKDCEWLGRRSNKQRKNVCTKYDAFDSGYPTARFVCPVTCEVNLCKK